MGARQRVDNAYGSGDSQDFTPSGYALTDGDIVHNYDLTGNYQTSHKAGSPSGFGDIIGDMLGTIAPTALKLGGVMLGAGALGGGLGSLFGSSLGSAGMDIGLLGDMGASSVSSALSNAGSLTGVGGLENLPDLSSAFGDSFNPGPAANTPDYASAFGDGVTPPTDLGTGVNVSGIGDNSGGLPTSNWGMDLGTSLPTAGDTSTSWGGLQSLWDKIQKNPLSTASSLFDLYAKLNMSNQKMDRYNQINDAINNTYAPGSPEFNYLWNEMSRQDAKAGRNSQYGPRAVDLASKLAGLKLNALTGNALNQNNLQQSALTNKYDGLNTLFFLAKQNGGS